MTNHVVLLNVLVVLNIWPCSWLVTVKSFSNKENVSLWHYTSSLHVMTKCWKGYKMAAIKSLQAKWHNGKILFILNLPHVYGLDNNIFRCIEQQQQKVNEQIFRSSTAVNKKQSLIQPCFNHKLGVIWNEKQADSGMFWTDWTSNWRIKYNYGPHCWRNKEFYQTCRAKLIQLGTREWTRHKHERHALKVFTILICSLYILQYYEKESYVRCWTNYVGI